MEKIFFKKGDVVVVKELQNRPLMIVKNIEKMRSIANGEESILLLGIRCFWFNNYHQYCEQLFNTKDLQLA